MKHKIMNEHKNHINPMWYYFAREHFYPCRINKGVRLDQKSHAKLCNVCFCAVTEDQH